MYTNTKFPWQQEAVIRHNQRLLRSFQYWTWKVILVFNIALSEATLSVSVWEHGLFNSLPLTGFKLTK